MITRLRDELARLALEAERLKTDKYLAARSMEQLELKLANVRTRMESVKERIVREREDNGPSRIE